MLIFTSPIYKDLAALIIAAGTGRDFLARGVQASAITGKLALHLLSQTLPAFLQTFGTCSLVPAWFHVACSHRQPQLGWYPGQHRAGTVTLLPCARCCLPCAGVQQSRAGDPEGPLTAPRHLPAPSSSVCGRCDPPSPENGAGVWERSLSPVGSDRRRCRPSLGLLEPSTSCRSTANPTGQRRGVNGTSRG